MSVWKKALVTFMLLLMCFVFIGTASADYGYTTVDQIPMAVDFNVTVEFDSAGYPHVVTDYPFAEAGATEMNLVYNKGSQYEAAVLNYNAATDVTSLGGWDSNLYPNDTYQNIYRDIREGVLSLDSGVFINTSYFGADTDWVLTYSTILKGYVEYTEKTYAQAFNAMASGGTAETVYYQNGSMISSRILKRIEDADLLIEYDRSGDIRSACVQTFGIVNALYNYDSASGRFGKYTLEELGFDEEDLSLPAPAAIGGEGIKVSSRGFRQIVRETPAITVAGGLIVGIMIGLILYYRRRRRSENTEE